MTVLGAVAPPPRAVDAPAGPAPRTGALNDGRLGHSGRHAEGFSERRHAAQGDHHQGLSRPLRISSRAPARRSSISRVPSPTRPAAITARCSPRRAATASSRRSRRWSISAPASSTPRRCRSSTRPGEVLAAADDKTVPHRILVYFGVVEDQRFDRFGRLLFDWFRCPVARGDGRERRPPADQAACRRAGRPSCRRPSWASSTRPSTTTPGANGARRRTAPRRAIPLPSFTIRTRSCRRPSLATLKHWARIAEKLGVEVEPITQARPRPARRVRRAVHPRDHVDRQPHLPFRPAGDAGGHAGHRRPDLDDPLHQQDLSARADDGERHRRAADGHHRR